MIYRRLGEMDKTVMASADAVAPEYQVDKDNTIQFIFYTFPVSVNGSIVLGEQVLGWDTFWNFVDSIRMAMRAADLQGLIKTHKAEESGQSSYSEYIRIFTVLSDDGNQSETASRMIHVALHQWGEPGRSLPDTEKELKRRERMREHAPKIIDGSECIIVDCGYNDEMEPGKQGDFCRQEAMIEIVSDSNVRVKV